MRCMCGAPHLTSVAGHHGSPPIIMMLHQRSPRVLGRVTAAHHLAIILACVTPCASPTSARNIAVHVFPLAPPPGPVRPTRSSSTAAMLSPACDAASASPRARSAASPWNASSASTAADVSPEQRHRSAIARGGPKECPERTSRRLPCNDARCAGFHKMWPGVHDRITVLDRGGGSHSTKDNV